MNNIYSSVMNKIKMYGIELEPMVVFDSNKNYVANIILFGYCNGRLVDYINISEMSYKRICEIDKIILIDNKRHVGCEFNKDEIKVTDIHRTKNLTNNLVDYSLIIENEMYKIDIKLVIREENFNTPVLKHSAFITLDVKGK